MPQQREVAETYWSVCWKWIFPYPCRKTHIVTRWCYDFSFLHVSYRVFRSVYRGCELNIIYQWSRWEPTGRVEEFTLYFYTKCFKDLLSPGGPCSPEPVLRHLKNVLGPDPIRTLGRPEEQGGHPASPFRPTAQ